MTGAEASAAELTEATRAGRLADAYRVLQAQPFGDLAPVALRAGFVCIATRNRREFMAHLTSQVAEAARRRTDGFGLREHRDRAAE